MSILQRSTGRHLAGVRRKVAKYGTKNRTREITGAKTTGHSSDIKGIMSKELARSPCGRAWQRKTSTAEEEGCSSDVRKVSVVRTERNASVGQKKRLHGGQATRDHVFRAVEMTNQDPVVQSKQVAV
jgi:hypothetical protein